MVYLSLSVPCLQKFKIVKKSLVVKPMIFSDMNSGAKVYYLTDIQSEVDTENKWILAYQQS